MTAPVQTGRLIQLTTPLGGDVLIATEVSGDEGLSRLFRFTVEMSSTNAGITADSLLGKSMTVKLARPGEDPRAINGIVTAFSAADQMVNGMRRYQAVIEPKLWLLTRTADCRIFQNQTVVQIAETLLSDGGITDYKKQGISGTHPSREYCVQYRETDFDFLVRILAEEGIYFYFQHESGKHTLVLSDSTSGYTDCADKSVQHAQPTSSLTLAVHTFSSGYSFQSGKTTLKDYDFEQPTSDLTATTTTVLTNSAFKSWEIFDYPGDYTQKSDGTSLSRTRMETPEAAYAVASGTATYPSFVPGAKFTMAKHEVASEQNKQYVLETVTHHARDLSHLGNQDDAVGYSNRFTALPATVAYRPPPVTRRPLIPGPQTALVVGPSGEEIYCDKYGRVKLQFYWDRLGKKNEQSSCWVRVGQWISGATWGSQFTPRVGMEVIVAFLEGDPDRPLVVGSAYNGQNMPPYTLPDNKTQSGIKTRSSSGGSATTFNELRFEDKKDSELVYMHAQKDFTREVVNDDTLTVQHDQTITVKNNRTETVQEGNESVTISKGNRSVTISEGNESLTVTKGNQSVTVSQGNQTTTVSKGNSSTTVSSGNYTLDLGSGNATLKCDGGSITLQAAQTITLKVGGNSITINQSGITLSATQISLSGSAKVQVSGPMVNISGSGTVSVKGGLVNIN
ncbi:type VI secretion system Vgr family protein [Aquabacter spiritensis]|uniref:Type VI secretion system secreted protein VgrG n=1 Tax=Aquabacter spiritensis TaxID=933073 RepID=A0A4R3LPZ8_9HYPH|nr:type VI secretion system Vgr family protein [Aquabacter spiritensis]TCT02470.1 type VI secretion system secreted protein VgrG [Aquabacter spiritensis]